MDILSITVVGGILFWFIFLRRHGNGPQDYIIRKAKKYDFSYQTKDVKVPGFSGFFLRLVARVVNSLFGQFFAAQYVLGEGEFSYYRNVKFEEGPTFYPHGSFDGECARPDEKTFSDLDIEEMLKKTSIEEIDGDKFHFNSIYNYVACYKSGELSPTEVAERAISALDGVKELNAIIKYDVAAVREMATASTERYKNNEMLSPVDGVLVVVKDEFAVKGFSYSKGTSFLGSDGPSAYDSEVVIKLKNLGVIILAIGNMHELGLGTSGNNSNKGFGACRTPYNTNHYSGGSSSGSASSVAAGLCSLGLGTDGGGSVRIPASYCGVVGLKPTFARITLKGVGGLSHTVGHCGPICTNVRDTAVFYALLGGPNLGFEVGLNQPPIRLPKFEENLQGLKIAIDRRYFEDCVEDVHKTCQTSLIHLEQCGATIQTIEIPEIYDAIIGHRICILSEMTSNMLDGFDNNFHDISAPLRILFKVGQKISAVDYLQANKQRTRSMAFLKELFKDFDAIVVPSTGHSAPPVVRSEISDGCSSSQQDTMNMRYAGFANFTGIPAITIPVGYNKSGLPVGLQFMSAWWREDIILKIAECVERRIRLQRPQVYVDLLAT